MAENQIAAPFQTGSERFMNNVLSQFAAEAGSPVKFDQHEKMLAQHLFLKLDSALKGFEDKRIKDGKTNQAPFVWANVDMRKLSLDAVHSVQLGLDALVDNHIYPIPYFNGKSQKYDIDLRVGYKGKAYYRIEKAIEKPKDVVIELVYSSDKFKPIKKSFSHEIETYEFEITNPFNRGSVIGGFGYLVYDDPSKNKLILVSEAEFEKSRKAAKGDSFWSKYPVEMRFKTLVHRITDKIKVDPRKVNASYLYYENKDAELEHELDHEIEQNANQEVVDVEVNSSEADQQPIQDNAAEQRETISAENQDESPVDDFEAAAAGVPGY